MRLLRSAGLVLRIDGEVRRDLDTRRRQTALEEMSIARCPKCGGELVARMARGRPAFWCRCPVRRGLAIGA